MTDIKKETVEVLKKNIADLQEQLRVFRFEGAGSRLRNVRGGRNLRHEIARALTELRTREIAVTKPVAISKVASKATTK